MTTAPSAHTIGVVIPSSRAAGMEPVVMRPVAMVTAMPHSRARFTASMSHCEMVPSVR